MREIVFFLATASVCSSPCFADENRQNPSQLESQQEIFKPFTGKITRNKVRMRLKPSLEAPILKELSHEEMVIVTGESDEFYAVKPPKDVKAYVFRTFVLDNTIEGNHVNVRLEPDTEAPIIGQLNSGDSVFGTISPLNSKWLEIDPPASTKFFICKEYVQNIGDPSVLEVLSKRKEDVNAILEEGIELSDVELQKPFEEIHLERSMLALNKILSEYSDFPSQVLRAKEQLAVIQETYLQKKLAYLENKAQHWEQLNPKPVSMPASILEKDTQEQIADNESPWSSIEQTFYEEWFARNPKASLEEFYIQQHKNALQLTGIVEPYVRTVKNKPGDFILISKNSRLPVAYLYSTRVDLKTKIGQEVTLAVLPRPNHEFAFPAYFVLSAE